MACQYPSSILEVEPQPATTSREAGRRKYAGLLQVCGLAGLFLIGVAAWVVYPSHIAKPAKRVPVVAFSLGLPRIGLYSPGSLFLKTTEDGRAASPHLSKKLPAMQMSLPTSLRDRDGADPSAPFNTVPFDLPKVSAVVPDALNTIDLLKTAAVVPDDINRNKALDSPRGPATNVYDTNFTIILKWLAVLASPFVMVPVAIFLFGGAVVAALTRARSK